MAQNEIDAFLAIIKAGSISKAAEDLYTTQSALSRRLKVLEDGLGYPLIARQRGIRNIELTAEGSRFIELAERWITLRNEMQDLCVKKPHSTFRISSIDSVGTYLFQPVYQSFIQNNPQVLLDIRDLDENQAYPQVETGLIDLAFIIDPRFSEKVITLPAFSESMRLICSQGYSLPSCVHPKDLIPEHEICVTWGAEYEKWHRVWFPQTSRPYITIEKMSHLEYFICNAGSWAIVPSSVATALSKKNHVLVFELMEPPPKRIISYLSIAGKKKELLNGFFNCLRENIQNIASFGVEVLF